MQRFEQAMSGEGIATGALEGVKAPANGACLIEITSLQQGMEKAMEAGQLVLSNLRPIDQTRFACRLVRRFPPVAGGRGQILPGCLRIDEQGVQPKPAGRR